MTQQGYFEVYFEIASEREIKIDSLIHDLQKLQSNKNYGQCYQLTAGKWTGKIYCHLNFHY